MDINRLKNNVLLTFSQGGMLNIKSITLKNLPFFLSWILMLLWLDTFALQGGAFFIEAESIGIFVGNIYSYVYAVIAAVFILFFNVKILVRFTACGSFAALTGFLTTILFPGNTLSSILLIVSGIGMGLVIATNFYSFTMVLNNTEKFYSMVIEFCIARLIIFLKPYTDTGILKLIMTEVMPVALLFVLTVCAVFFKNGSRYSDKKRKEVKIPNGVYSVLFIVLSVFVLNEGVAFAILKTTESITAGNIEKLYTAGAVIGVIIILIFQPILKRSIWHMWNLSFAILAVGFIVSIFDWWNSTFSGYSAVLFGCAYATSYINIFYMSSIMIKKYQSMKLLRIGVLTAAVSGVLSFTTSSVILSADSITVLAVSLLISIAVILVFFMLAPLFVKELYSAEWMDDMYRLDVILGDRFTAKLKEAGLSPREIEVCTLLLEGYTMRQIAATLLLAYPTINTHCVNIYRKLCINSRTELIVKFGEHVRK